MVRNNNNQKPFACQECPSRFSANSTLLSHVRGVHEGKTFQCENCNRQPFTDRSNYKRHVAQCQGSGLWYHCPWDTCNHCQLRRDNAIRHRGTCRVGVRLGSRAWRGALPEVLILDLKMKTDIEAGRVDVRALQTREPSGEAPNPEVPQQAPGQQAQLQVTDEDPAQHDAAALGQGGYQPAANVNLDDIDDQFEDNSDFDQQLALSALRLANDNDLQVQDNLAHNGQDFHLGMDPQELNIDNVDLQAQVNLGQNGQDFTINPQQLHWDNGQGWNQEQNYLVPNFNNTGYLPQGALAYNGQDWNQEPMLQNPTFDNAGHWAQGQQAALGDDMFLGQAQYQVYNNVGLQGQFDQGNQTAWGTRPQQQFVGNQAQDMVFLPTMNQNVQEDFWDAAVF